MWLFVKYELLWQVLNDARVCCHCNVQLRINFSTEVQFMTTGAKMILRRFLGARHHLLRVLIRRHPGANCARRAFATRIIPILLRRRIVSAGWEKRQRHV